MSCPCTTPGADCPLLPFPSAQESPWRLWGLLLPEDKQSAQPGLAHGLEGHLTIRQNPSFLAGPISTLIPCTGLGTSGNCWPLASAMHHSGILGPLRATGPAGRGQADQAWEAGERGGPCHEAWLQVPHGSLCCLAAPLPAGEEGLGTGMG